MTQRNSVRLSVTDGFSRQKFCGLKAPEAVQLFICGAIPDFSERHLVTVEDFDHTVAIYADNVWGIHGQHDSLWMYQARYAPNPVLCWEDEKDMHFRMKKQDKDLWQLWPDWKRKTRSIEEKSYRRQTHLEGIRCTLDLEQLIWSLGRRESLCPGLRSQWLNTSRSHCVDLKAHAESCSTAEPTVRTDRPFDLHGRFTFDGDLSYIWRLANLFETLPVPHVITLHGFHGMQKMNCIELRTSAIVRTN